jgi:hypothetical protein
MQDVSTIFLNFTSLFAPFKCLTSSGTGSTFGLYLNLYVAPPVTSTLTRLAG